MARRRKIPVRKHHGIRDPLKQREEREKKLKNVTNNPPVKDAEQKVSFKFAQFKKLADDAKAGKKFKKLHSGREDKPKPTAATKTTTKNAAQQNKGNKFKMIKQQTNETDADYLKRVNRITSESLKEAQYEAKYGVNVVRNAKTGEISIQKKPKNEIDELLKQKALQKGKQRKKQQAVKAMDPKLAKQLIKQAIHEDEAERRKETQTELQEYQKDEIRFGEIVHAPPTLTALPRKAEKRETVPRPGKKNNLLLKQLLKDENTKETAATTTPTAANAVLKPKVLAKKRLQGKRKHLPDATRAMLETEQTKMIELYRQLKKAKETTIKT